MRSDWNDLLRKKSGLRRQNRIELTRWQVQVTDHTKLTQSASWFDLVSAIDIAQSRNSGKNPEPTQQARKREVIMR